MPAAGAVRPEAADRADRDRGVARRHLRQAASTARAGKQRLPRHQRAQQDHGGEPRLRRAARRLAGLARDRAADAAEVRSASSSSATRARSELGFNDLGALWRSNYDMPPDEFAAELDRLWAQVQAALRRAARARARALGARSTAPTSVPADGPIPAHLLGNMWAQEWGNIYDARRRPQGVGPGYDLTALLKAQEGRREGDGALRRALLHVARLRAAARRPSGSARCSRSRRTARWSATRARGTSTTTTTCASRCASRSTGEDFVTIHHELGHNFYQRAYRTQPFLFQQQRQRRLPRGDRRHRSRSRSRPTTW